MKGIHSRFDLGLRSFEKTIFSEHKVIGSHYESFHKMMCDAEK